VQRGFGLVFDPMEMVVIHYVLAGTGWLQVGSGKAMPFAPHAILVVPPRQRQRLSAFDGDTQNVRAEENCSPLPDRLIKFEAGTGDGELLILCGTISVTYGGTFGLFDTLSEPIIEELGAVDHLRSAFQLMLAELSRPTIGTRALTEALMKQCLVVLLRQHFTRQPITSPLFAALQDQRLTQAVASIVEHPGARHSLQELAATAGMSRSSFTARFRAGLRPERARFRLEGSPSLCSAPAHHDRPADQGRRKQRRLRQPKPLLPRVQRSLWRQPDNLPVDQPRPGRAPARA
jgi:hypothetical protein